MPNQLNANLGLAPKDLLPLRINGPGKGGGAKGALGLAPKDLLPLRTNGPGKGSGAAPSEMLWKAAKDFESVFLYQILKQMRSSVHHEKLFHGGPGEDIFTEMMDEEFAKRMAEGESTGIAKMMYQQLSRQYGIGQPGENGMPGLSGPAGLLQEKLKAARSQVRTQDPQTLGF
ncbi:MAG: rod-binding protein [bacterium]|nr:rod-binding protein [bacterium]